MNGAVVHAYSKAKDGNVYLSKNFRAREFACKDGSDTFFVSSDLVWRCCRRSGTTSGRR